MSDPQRRVWIQGGLGALVGGAFAPWLAGCATTPRPSGPLIGFKSITPDASDALRVPEGYVARPFAPWGEPVGVAGNMPEWKDDASNSAADQAVQMGMHHDGLHYYPLDGSTPRPAGDEPRVHRRRAAAPRWLEDLVGREDAQVAERAWRVGDRGAS